MEEENRKLEAALARKKELLDQADEMRRREGLSGRSVMAAPEPKKELTPTEYKNLVEKGIIPKK